jgi:glycosyltransferase 2 family protein
MHLRSTWKPAVRIVLSGAALAVIIFAAQLDTVVAALARADPGWIAIGFALNLVTRFAAAERTYAISRSVSLPVTRAQTVEALFVSNFWSLALPGAAAGSVMTVFRYSRYGAPVAESLGVLGASRVIELAMFCAFGAVAFSLSPHGSNAHVVAVLCMICALVLSVFALAHRYSDQTIGMISARAPANSLRGKLSHSAGRAFASFTGARRSELLMASSVALVQCALDAASVMALAWSLGLSVSWLDALWINVLAYLAILLPISVAGLGVRELAVIVALTPLGIPKEEALALSVLMFGATLLNALIGGVVQLATRPRPVSRQSTC